VSNNFTQAQIQSILDHEINSHESENDTEVHDMPEETRVVIESVPDDQIVAVISAKFLSFNSLADFQQ
jgi:hypothetical protein